MDHRTYRRCRLSRPPSTHLCRCICGGLLQTPTQGHRKLAFSFEPPLQAGYAHQRAHASMLEPAVSFPVPHVSDDSDHGNPCPAIRFPHLQIHFAGSGFAELAKRSIHETACTSHASPRFACLLHNDGRESIMYAFGPHITYAHLLSSFLLLPNQGIFSKIFHSRQKKFS